MFFDININDAVAMPIYWNEHVHKRLKGIKKDAAKFGLSVYDFCDLAGISPLTVHNYFTPRHRPTLRKYLLFAELLDWNLSRDINYWFAKRLLPTRDILRRIKRTGLPLNAYIAASGFRPRYVMASLKYQLGGTPEVFGSVIKFLAVNEQCKGFDDALDCE